MPPHAKLDTLPKAVKDEIIKRILSRESYEAIHNWLLEQHRIEISAMALNRSCKPIFDAFIELVDRGMPIEEVIKNRPKIEAIGIDEVKRLLIEKLTENPGSLFAYLDEPKAGQ